MSSDANGNAVDRQALVDRIAALRDEELKSLPAIAQAEDDARAHYQVAKKALDEATAAVNAAASKRMDWSFRFSNAIAGLERQLRDSADVSIRDFVLALDLQIDRERTAGRNPVVERIQTNQLDPNTGGRRVVIRSDYRSRARRLDALLAALVEARDIVSVEIHDAESLARRLRGLRDRLPEIAIEDPEPPRRTA